MNSLDVATSDEYAAWFRCLANGTRVRILSFVAGAGRKVTVGEIVAEVGKSQSTVSRHVQRLAAEGYVFTETVDVRTLVEANPACMTALPAAATAIMSSPVAAARPSKET